MYLDYFSLKRHPFRITPDPSLFFPGGAHGRGVVLDALVYAITTGEGILKVVGEVGSGKTMLCRMLEEKLPATVEIVYLANPNLSARDIIFAIAFELKLGVDSATDRLLVMQKIQAYLLQRHAEGASVVVFIEEAQSMPLETLEEVRLLSNLETHRHKLMQIVLFGQPELDRKLQLKSIRQLRERITHSFHLEPLSELEIREYLHFRLQAAGCPWPQLFSVRAEKLLAAATGGLTRRVNILADKALLAAYADPATRPQPRNGAGEIQAMVLPRHVRTAIADSGYKRLQSAAIVPWLGYALAAVSTATLAGVLLYGNVFPRQEAPAAGPALAANTVGGQTPSPTIMPTQSAPPVQFIPPAQTGSPLQISGPTLTLPAERGNTAEPANATELAANATTQDAAPLEVAGTYQPATEGEASTPEVTTAEATTAEATTAEATKATTAAAVLPVNHEPADSESVRAAALTTALVVPPAVNQIPAADSKAQAVQNAFAGLTGLAALRLPPSAAWLATLPSKSGYTVQLYSTSIHETEMLDEMLEFLALTEMLNQSYLCLITGSTGKQDQVLVMHGEFAGLSEVRKFIRDLPPYISRFQPYARNLNDIACVNRP